MPAELAQKIERASTFRQGFDTVEYLASALVDMKLHLAGARPIDPDAFERETLAALGMPSEIVMRHRTPQFTHVFSGDGYAAGYYSYLWSDVLAADAWEAFTEAGGPWDEAVAKRLRESVFSVGNTVDPADGYRAFRGRDARIDALMRKRGFPVPAHAEGRLRDPYSSVGVARRGEASRRWRRRAASSASPRGRRRACAPRRRRAPSPQAAIRGSTR